VCVRSTFVTAVMFGVEWLWESFGRGVDIEEEACLLRSEAREGFSMAPKATGAAIEEVVAGELVAEVPLELTVAVADAVVVVLLEVEAVGYAAAAVAGLG
jgi:hypothetical protein